MLFSYETGKDGTILEIKARPVARGFSQVAGVDFYETYAPTPEQVSVRVVVATPHEKGWKIHHFDAKQTFIRAKLDYHIYIRLPQGCGNLSGKTTLLKRTLYSLKQSGRQWANKC